MLIFFPPLELSSSAWCGLSSRTESHLGIVKDISEGSTTESRRRDEVCVEGTGTKNISFFSRLFFYVCTHYFYFRFLYCGVGL